MEACLACSKKTTPGIMVCTSLGGRSGNKAIVHAFDLPPKLEQDKSRLACDDRQIVQVFKVNPSLELPVGKIFNNIAIPEDAESLGYIQFSELEKLTPSLASAFRRVM